MRRLTSRRFETFPEARFFMRSFPTLLPLSLLVAAPALAAPDAEAGKVAYAACAACHGAGGGGMGPKLAGVIGRKAGSLSGFAYSPAMKASNITWDTAQMDAFITKPQSVVKGTRMFFPGLADAKKRMDLVAFLKTLK
jgi:cytochrome c